MNQGLAIKIRRSRAEGGSVSVVIGKNTLKKASERNLLRRRIRAILSPPILGSGEDVTVIVKDGQKNVSFSELKNRILDLFNKTKK